MAKLSKDAKTRIITALNSKVAGDEVAAAIDNGNSNRGVSNVTTSTINTIVDNKISALSPSAITSKLLTGYVLGTNTPISAGNSILIALENLQAQLDAIVVPAGSTGAWMDVAQKTAPFTILSSEDKFIFFVDTTIYATQIPVTLPLSPPDGFMVRLVNKFDTWSTYGGVAVFAQAGNTIDNASDTEVAGDIGFVDFTYDAQTTNYTQFRYLSQNVSFGSANIHLSNLQSPTAVNVDLLPGTTNNRSMGSPTKRWTAVHSQSFVSQFGISVPTASFTAGQTSPSGLGIYSGLVYTADAGTSNPIGIMSDSTSTSSTVRIGIETGNVLGGVADSGAIIHKTGNSAGGNSGDIVSETGTAGGVRGQLQFKDGTEGTAGYVWTSTDVTGKGSWAAAGGGGANTALSNLIPTAINQDLLPDATFTRSLGSSAKRWAAIWCQAFVTTSTKLILAGGVVNLDSSPIMPSGAGASGAVSQDGLGSVLGVYTQSSTSAGASPSSNISIETGNRTAGTSNSGDINMQTGTSAGGSRGKVVVNAAALSLLPQGSPPSSPVNGDIYFDGTNIFIRVAGAWKTFTLT